MSRVALVTGGSRGIGAAISIALKDAGYKVAATYAGNDEAAAKIINVLRDHALLCAGDLFVGYVLKQHRVVTLQLTHARRHRVRINDIDHDATAAQCARENFTAWARQVIDEQDPPFACDECERFCVVVHANRVAAADFVGFKDGAKTIDAREFERQIKLFYRDVACTIVGCGVIKFRIKLNRPVIFGHTVAAADGVVVV